MFWHDHAASGQLRDIGAKTKTEPTTANRPIAVDLFAGCGGLSLGFKQAGFDVAAAVEIDPIHSAVHKYNFPSTMMICADVKNISGEDVRRLAKIGNCDIDVVMGGAPCQGFSMIGKRSFDDPRNQLVSHFVRLVGGMRPKYCVFENVKGLTVGKHARFLDDLIGELSVLEYQVISPYRVLNAADYGIPQNRHRLFLLAARKDRRLPQYPHPAKVRVTVGEAINDLPDAEKFNELLDNDSVRVEWPTISQYAARLRGVVSDPADFSHERHYDKGLLTASLRTEHTEESRRRFAETLSGKTEPRSRFYKLDANGQCNTLRAGTDSARGAFTSPRPIHPVHPRVITVREAARLHSYPDWFRFHKTKWHGCREIGNSVPPLLARAVGASIIAALGASPVRPAKILMPPETERLIEFDMGSAAAYFVVPRNVIAQRTRKNIKKHEHKETQEPLGQPLFEFDGPHILTQAQEGEQGI